MAVTVPAKRKTKQEKKDNQVSIMMDRWRGMNREGGEGGRERDRKHGQQMAPPALTTYYSALSVSAAPACCKKDCSTTRWRRSRN